MYISLATKKLVFSPVVSFSSGGFVGEVVSLITLNRILVCLNILSYLWSVIGVFKSNKERATVKYRGLQIFSILTWASCIYAIFAVDLSPVRSVSLLVLQVICLVTFWGHAQLVRRHNFTIVYSLDQPQKLIKSGLYAYIRNPFYLTYLICYFSVGILTYNWIVMAFSTAMMLFYIDAAKMEERKFINSSLATEYSDYIGQTGRFFPKIF